MKRSTWVGLARWAGPAAFSRGTLSCSFATNAHTLTRNAKALGASRGFRPLDADGDASAQRPYLTSHEAVSANPDSKMTTDLMKSPPKLQRN